MKESTGAITFKGNPLTLLGNEITVGDVAPDCELLGNDLSPVRLSSYDSTPRKPPDLPAFLKIEVLEIWHSMRRCV